MHRLKRTFWSRPDNARLEIEDVIGIDATHAIPCSAKTGLGIAEAEMPRSETSKVKRFELEARLRGDSSSAT